MVYCPTHYCPVFISAVPVTCFETYVVLKLMSISKMNIISTIKSIITRASAPKVAPLLDLVEASLSKTKTHEADYGRTKVTVFPRSSPFVIVTDDSIHSCCCNSISLPVQLCSSFALIKNKSNSVGSKHGGIKH